ncbi:hypothetical protein H5410_015510 [Solanum commersonii]|uniref:Uncharacterized protein n=1 Tax=Solanum commersonii TaxID=4109 RepID=A0A9J5ZTW3_SOLCO|nr:hypothetical protein H5410_015510 [Solanum commersonii]
MSRDVGFGVLEMGMSKKGEILELSRMCRPDLRCSWRSFALVGKSLSRYVPLDVHNASPASTQAAIVMLRNTDCKGKRVAILGDMLELGPTEFKFHELMVHSCCDAHV